MNPLEQIERGIKNSDWDLVVKGYNAMTGKSLVSNDAGMSLQSVITYLSTLIEVGPAKTPAKNKKGPKGKKARVAADPDLVLDNPDTDDLFRQESRRLAGVANTKSYRDPVNLAGIKCSGCKESFPPSQIVRTSLSENGNQTTYWCNRCVNKN